MDELSDPQFSPVSTRRSCWVSSQRACRLFCCRLLHHLLQLWAWLQFWQPFVSLLALLPHRHACDPCSQLTSRAWLPPLPHACPSPLVPVSRRSTTELSRDKNVFARDTRALAVPAEHGAGSWLGRDPHKLS